MGLILGGSKAWKVRRVKEFVVAYHWIGMHGEREPTMCIWPQRKPLGCVPFCIPLSTAYQYANRDGYPTPQLVEACARGLVVMGMAQTRQSVHGLADVILDGIEDLVKMPPEPPALAPAQGKPVGEATFYAGGSKVAEGEIMDVPTSLH